eukprot:m.102871 g.102871  ORF g.102871 m.102871 type:complete len:1482 (+) comp27446_c0_seq1:169-4614(+)
MASSIRIGLHVLSLCVVALTAVSGATDPGRQNLTSSFDSVQIARRFVPAHECVKGQKKCRKCSEYVGMGCIECKGFKKLHEGICLKKCPEGTYQKGNSQYGNECHSLNPKPEPEPEPEQQTTPQELEEDSQDPTSATVTATTSAPPDVVENDHQRLGDSDECTKQTVAGDALFACGPVDLMFLLDSSGSFNIPSIGGTPRNFQDNVLTFVDAVASRFDVGLDDDQTRVGVSTFSGTADLRIALGEHGDMCGLSESISTIPYVGGPTYTSLGLENVLFELMKEGQGLRPAPANVRRVLVVLTDGNFKKGYSPKIAVQSLHKAGVEIIPVGIGLKLSHRVLSLLASSKLSNKFTVDSATDLVSLLPSLTDAICGSVSSSPPDAPQDPQDPQDPTGTETQGSTDGDVAFEGCGKKDVLFVLDNSADWSDAEAPHTFHDLSLGFIRKLLPQMLYGASKSTTRVQVTTTGNVDNAYDVPLDFYTKPTPLDKAVAEVPYPQRGVGDASTFAAAALRRIVTQLSTATNNDRDAESVARTIVILTPNVATTHADIANVVAELASISNAPTIITLEVGGTTDGVLAAIASTPALAFNTPTPTSMFLIANQVLGAVCSTTPNVIAPPVSTPEPACELARASDDACGALDLMFLLDSSGSMNIPRLGGVLMSFQEKVLGFVKATISKHVVGSTDTRVGVATFSGSAIMHIALNDHFDGCSLESAIDAIPYVGGVSNLAPALQVVVDEMMLEENGLRPSSDSIKRVLMIITDGVTIDFEAEELATQLRDLGVTIVVVGLKVSHDDPGLSALSNNNQHKFLTVPTAADIFTLTDKATTAMCIAGGAEEELCSPTMSSLDPLFACGPLDLMFLLDVSGSINIPQFGGVPRTFQDKILPFVRSMIPRFIIGDTDTRVGVATFSGKARVVIHLNDFDNACDLDTAIAAVPYLGGPSRSSVGLEVVLNEMMLFENGLRPTSERGVRRVLVVITDGPSDQGHAPSDAATALHNEGVSVITIGVGMLPTSPDLIAIASSTRHVVTVSDATQLNGVHDDVMAKTCPVTFDKPSCALTTMASENYACGPLDLMFLLDSSGSFNNPALGGAPGAFQQYVLGLVAKIVSRVVVGDQPGDTRVGVATYSGVGSLRISLNDEFDGCTLQEMIKTIPYRGGPSHTSVGFQTIVDEMMKESAGLRPTSMGVKRVLVVISDGTTLGYEPGPGVAALQTNGVTIIAIGVGGDANVEAIGSRPDLVLNAPFVRDLPKLEDALVTAMCQGTPVSALSVPCSLPAHVPTVDHSGCRQLDLMFLLDVSGSINIPQLGGTLRAFQDRVLAFVRTLLNRLTIDRLNTRVSVATFSGKAQAHVYLNDFVDACELDATVAQIPYVGGPSRTSLGLRLIAKNIMSQDKGLRSKTSGAHRVLIVVTDGEYDEGYDVAPEVADLRSKEATVIAVGIGMSSTSNVLSSMASSPEYIFTSSNITTLVGEAMPVLDALNGICSN